MDIMNLLSKGIEKTQSLQDTFAKDAIKKKHKIRIKFYQLVMDYVNSPGSPSPNAFFTWYLEQLDIRIRNKPEWMRAYYKLSGQKNEQSFRSFLESCEYELGEKPQFIEVLKAWIPDDEYRMIASTTSSNITSVLMIAIEMANDKQDTEKQIKGAIFSNLPLILFGVGFHWFIFTFVYRSFVTPGFQDIKTWEEMTTVEANYLVYAWFMEYENIAIVFGAIIGLVMTLSWITRNWTTRFIRIRENYIDYLPPFSLSKLNNQYSIIMIVTNFMKSGKSFSDALIQASEGASPYVQYQVSKIQSNSALKANDAIAIFYLGDYGSDIQERGANVPLQNAMQELLPSIKKKKMDSFNTTIKITLMLTLKPVVYISFGMSLVPLVMGIFASLPTI